MHHKGARVLDDDMTFLACLKKHLQNKMIDHVRYSIPPVIVFYDNLFERGSNDISIRAWCVVTYQSCYNMMMLYIN